MHQGEQNMQKLIKAFIEHPQSVDETYWQHMLFAGSFSYKLTLAAMAAMVHAIFPFLFEKTASTILQGLVNKMHNRS